MTELEKEIKNYIDKNCKQWETDGLTVDDIVRIAVLDFAEPREKQIQIDAEQIRALQKQNGELTDDLTKKSDTNHRLVEQLAKLNERRSELETQIEKMKNWCNCKNYQKCLIELAEQGKGMKPSECCVNCKKWEIKEK